jgi:hypothetical protein
MISHGSLFAVEEKDDTMSFCYSTTNRQYLSVLSGKLPVPLLPAGHVVCLKVLQVLQIVIK